MQQINNNGCLLSLVWFKKINWVCGSTVDPQEITHAIKQAMTTTNHPQTQKRHALLPHTRVKNPLPAPATAAATYVCAYEENVCVYGVGTRVLHMCELPLETPPTLKGI